MSLPLRSSSSSLTRLVMVAGRRPLRREWPTLRERSLLMRPISSVKVSFLNWLWSILTLVRLGRLQSSFSGKGPRRPVLLTMSVLSLTVFLSRDQGSLVSSVAPPISSSWSCGSADPSETRSSRTCALVLRPEFTMRMAMRRGGLENWRSVDTKSSKPPSTPFMFTEVMRPLPRSRLAWAVREPMCLLSVSSKRRRARATLYALWPRWATAASSASLLSSPGLPLLPFFRLIKALRWSCSSHTCLGNSLSGSVTLMRMSR
mmetsp:Transcript_16238/g.55147  ORF Transcript_16238/g.55147 Transcript_16238/m.55147 type:complete len:260 (+) Transcript_16238:3388-4167(+)